MSRPRRSLVVLLALSGALFAVQRRDERRSLCDALAGHERAQRLFACPVPPLPVLHHKRMTFTCFSERPAH